MSPISRTVRGGGALGSRSLGFALISVVSLAVVGCGGGEKGKKKDDVGDTDGDTDGFGCDTECYFPDDDCLIDADCGPGNACVLGICTPGCETNEDCSGDDECTAHGRCEPPPPMSSEDETGGGDDDGGGEPSFPEPRDGEARLTETDTLIGSAGGVAKVQLTNTGTQAMKYRLAAESDAVQLDPMPTEIAAGASVELEVEISPGDGNEDQISYPISVISDYGSQTWTVTRATTTSGKYVGVVTFEATAPLGHSPINMNLRFNDGDVSGQTFSAKSFLWPEDVRIVGTEDGNGNINIELADIVDVDGQLQDWVPDPIGHAFGRRVLLTGAVDADGGISGTVDEFLYGLSETPTLVRGEFKLTRVGEERPSSGQAMDYGDVQLDLPPDPFGTFDDEACGFLGNMIADLVTDPDDLVDLCGPYVPGDTCRQAYYDACNTFDANLDPKAGGTPVGQLAQAATDCSLALGSREARISSTDGLGIEDVDLAVDPGNNDIGPGQVPAAFTSCLDAGTASANDFPCVDYGRLSCATRFAQEAVTLAPDSATEYDAYLALVEATEAQAEAAGLLGLGRVVNAGLSYARDTTLSGVAEDEWKQYQLAQDLYSGPLNVMLSPGFLQGLSVLGQTVVQQQREGRDIANALTLSQHASDTLATMLQLRQRQLPAQQEELRVQAQVAALLLHAQGAMLAQRAQENSVGDPYGAIGTIGEGIEQMEAAFEDLGTENNPLGRSKSSVRFQLTPAEVGTKTNFQVVYEKTAPKLMEYVLDATATLQADMNLQANAFTAQTAFEETLESYDQELIALCGADPSDSNAPNLTSCGEDQGEIYQLVQLIETAQLHEQLAIADMAFNLAQIEIEEDRLRGVLGSMDETRDKIENLQQGIFRIMSSNIGSKQAARVAGAQAECSRIQEVATIDQQSALVGGLGGIAAAAGPPPNPGAALGAIANAGSAFAAARQKADIQCESVKADADLVNELEYADAVATAQMTVIDQEIDALLAESARAIEVENSKATVRSLAAQQTTLSLGLEKARLDVETAGADFRAGARQVVYLIERRERARRRLLSDPSNPYLNPAFLILRNELGKNLARARERALRSTYDAARALEYEINRDLPVIENDLFPARSPSEVSGVYTCLQDVYDDYIDEFGAPASYTLEVSLRDDVFGMDDDVYDQVTNEFVSPAEQFRALLRDEDNVRPDGSVVVGFGLPLEGRTLIDALRCDAKISGVEVKFVGDYLGDAEISVLLGSDGYVAQKRCDGDLLPADQKINYFALGSDQVSIQAGANVFGTAAPNFGFAGWGLAADSWELTIPSPSLSPANADLDLDSISDIQLKFTYSASTVEPAGTAPFSPTCN